MLRCCWDGCCENDDPLRAWRQLSDDIDALHGPQFTDLLESNFYFSGGDDSTNRVGFNLPAFGFDLIGDSELGK